MPSHGVHLREKGQTEDPLSFQLAHLGGKVLAKIHDSRKTDQPKQKGSGYEKKKKNKGADQKESSPEERDSQAPEGGLGIMPGTFHLTYFPLHSPPHPHSPHLLFTLLSPLRGLHWEPLEEILMT